MFKIQWTIMICICFDPFLQYEFEHGLLGACYMWMTRDKCHTCAFFQLFLSGEPSWYERSSHFFAFHINHMNKDAHCCVCAYAGSIHASFCLSKYTDRIWIESRLSELPCNFSIEREFFLYNHIQNNCSYGAIRPVEADQAFRPHLKRVQRTRFSFTDKKI